MEDSRMPQCDPFETPFDDGHTADTREDWEDWEDDDDSLPADRSGAGPSAQPPRYEATTVQSANQPDRGIKDRRSSHARYLVQPPKRLKSAGRQKAQIAKAGIKLVTDMSALRRQQQQQQQSRFIISPDERTGKFVDAAALRALEGDPTSATVGSWSWLRRKQSKGVKEAKSLAVGNRRTLRAPEDSPQGLSPSDQPIVIGLALPEEDLASRIISPQTATVETPQGIDKYFPNFKSSKTAGKAVTRSPEEQQRSVWSPDTEDGGSPSSRFQNRAVPSIYSQANCHLPARTAPPVPAVPSVYQARRQEAHIELDDEDAGTPITLFEEDGSPVYTRKSYRAKGREISPATTATRSGWWDHVQTPFSEHQPSPFTPKAVAANEVDSPASEWWKGTDTKNQYSPKGDTGAAESSSYVTPVPSGRREVPQIRVPSPAASSSSGSRSIESRAETHREKAAVLVEENTNPTEEPPPYSPPEKQNTVRDRAAFPPSHPLGAQFPPSPGPVSPGLQNTMVSSGAISMSDVPLTPPPATTQHGQLPLPDRAIGTFVPGDHFFQPVGRSPAAKTERQRRRHEKEDVFFHRLGGFWRGRGCLPENGCYGRKGREGRQRRRVCAGVCAGFIAVITLVAVLLTILLHKHTASSPPYSIWLNLTDFPPMPTGIMTVVGPDNSETVTGCVQPSTLWSCSLPKEQQAANQPFQANQPKYILQVQFDNSTRQFWNTTGVPPTPSPTPTPAVAQRPLASANTSSPDPSVHRRLGSSGFRDLLRRALLHRQSSQSDPGFSPNPPAPTFQEIWFLGNTTDGIVSDQKAGESTPFFISLLTTVNGSVGPNVLNSRGIGNGIDQGGPGSDASYNLTDLLPPPVLNPDGTGAPATMLTWPTQQPVRLFDRGLPTEHYGFYSYFNKTIYVKSVTPLTSDTEGQGNVPDDENGGSLETEANFLVTWAQTRQLVQIWTRLGNSSRLLGGGAWSSSNTTQPGTFPYPITVTEDTHGGNHDLKATYLYGVTDRQDINTTDVKLVINDIGFDSPVINPGATFNPTFGGMDGGTGGCKCGWVNFVNLNGGTIGQ